MPPPTKTTKRPIASQSPPPAPGTSPHAAAGEPPTQSPHQEPSLPPELRRPLRERMDAVLAHPQAARCTEPCNTCDGLPDALAEAALARWDMLARSGVWPVRDRVICGELRAHGIPVVFTRLQKLFQHRRWVPLARVVRADLAAWEQSVRKKDARP